jgi:hypothetical protein
MMRMPATTPTTSTSQLLQGLLPLFSRTKVALSVSILNLLMSPFGALPCCHGAGGLSAQHKFGARTGESVIFLGGLKVLLGVMFWDANRTSDDDLEGGGTLESILDALPSGILGVLLIVSGVELGSTGLSSLSSKLVGSAMVIKTQWFILGLTAAAILGSGKTHYGVLAGMAVHLLYGEGTSEYKTLWRERRTKKRNGEKKTID